MDAKPVDERDSSWDDNHPRFRIYIQDLPRPGYGSTTDTYDLEGADVLEAIAWAEARTGPTQTYSVALVREEHTPWTGAPPEPSRGLVWLLGDDVNGVDAPTFQLRTEKRGDA